MKIKLIPNNEQDLSKVFIFLLPLVVLLSASINFLKDSFNNLYLASPGTSWSKTLPLTNPVKTGKKYSPLYFTTNALLFIIRGKKNEPSFVKFTAEKLSEIRGISKSNLIDATTLNFNKLFN